jgi:hypothetical protein
MGSGHVLDSGRSVELKKKPEEGRGKNTLPEERREKNTLGRGTVEPEGEGNSVESSEAPQHKRRLCIFGCAMFG